MNEIVVNDCYGGFSLSDEAFELWLKRKKIKFYKRDGCDVTFGNDYCRIPFKEYEEETKKSLRDCGNYKNINDKDWWLSNRDIPRDDTDLIWVVKKLGKKANGMCADLKIVKIPDGIEWEINEYDGMESVHEKHRSWK